MISQTLLPLNMTLCMLYSCINIKFKLEKSSAIHLTFKCVVLSTSLLEVRVMVESEVNKVIWILERVIFTSVELTMLWPPLP